MKKCCINSNRVNTAASGWINSLNRMMTAEGCNALAGLGAGAGNTALVGMRSLAIVAAVLTPVLAVETLVDNTHRQLQYRSGRGSAFTKHDWLRVHSCWDRCACEQHCRRQHRHWRFCTLRQYYRGLSLETARWVLTLGLTRQSVPTRWK